VFIIILSILSALILGAGVFALIKKDGIKAITAVLCIVCMVVIAINTLVTQNTWVNELDQQTEYTFTGKIERIDKDLDNCNYILTDLTADGKEIDGNIYLTVNVIDGVQTSFLRAGDVVCFKSNADFVSFVKKGEVNGYNYRNNIRYFCSTNENTITFVCEKPTLMQSLRNTVQTLLTENMGEYGEIAFAMITGEKGGISDKITDAYSTGGIGHILAVSGLHVGFVVLIVSWILRKLKANRFVTFGVTSVILLWYCFLVVH
jgi:predicted membrane metal-binding protein